MKRLSTPNTSLPLAASLLCIFGCAFLLVISGSSCLAQQQYAQSTVATIPYSTQTVYMATDGKGNIILSEYGGYQQYTNGYVKEVPNGSGGYTEVSLGLGGYSFGNVAADASGNIYLNTDTQGVFYNTSITVYALSGTTYSAVGSVKNSGEGPIAVDNSGNIFVLRNTTVGNNSGPENYGFEVEECSPSGGGNYTTSVVVPQSSFKGTGIGLGVDGTGSFYYVDSITAGPSIVYKWTPTGKGFVQSVVGTIPTSATTLTADASGNVYIAASNGRIYKETLAGGAYTQSIAISQYYAVQTMVVLPDGSLSLYGGNNNLIAVKETPLATTVATPTAFAPVQVAGTPSSATVQFSFNAPVSLAATPYSIFNSDFTASPSQSSGACVSGHNYAIGDTCSLGINFAGTAPGERAGGVTLYGTNGQPVGSALLSGTAMSPLALIYPGFQSTLVGGLPQEPTGIALDAAGTIYVADPSNDRIVIESPTGSSYVQTILSSDLSGPSNVVVDGAGNLYIADAGHNRIVKETPSNGGYIESNVLTGYLGNAAPTNVAVDASGDVFAPLATYAAGTTMIVKETYSGGIYTPSVVESAPPSYVRGITADGQGNVYAITYNNAILKETFSSNTNSYTETQIPVSVLGASISVDAIGSLYVPGSYGIYEIPYSNGAYGTEFGVPGVQEEFGQSVTVDSNQTIYYTTAIGTYSGGPYAVLKLDTHHPPTLTYGSTAVGSTSGPQSVTLVNGGNSNLVFSTTASGTDPAFSLNSFLFASSVTCPIATTTSAASLSAGTSCLGAVNFTPTQPGPLSGTLTFTDNSLNSTAATQIVPLIGTGTGSAVSATLTPSTFSFFATTASAAASQTATLTNTGTTTLTIASITLGGANPTAFTQSSNCSATLAGGASCSITLGLVNTSAGTYAAVLTVADNATAGNQTATLTGTVTGVPQPTLTPSTLTFGSITVSTTSAAQTLTLANTGTAALTFISSSIYGTNPTSFAETNACPATLAIGASCSISVTCTPPSVGALSASLAVNFPSPLPQLASTLSCTGAAAAAPQAILAPATLSFTSAANSVAPNQTATLSNPGTAPLTIASLAISGLNASAFAIVTNTCGTTLAAGATCSLTLGPTVSTAGTYTATLIVTDNASPTTQTVALTDTVTGTPLAILTPSALTFTTTAGISTPAQTATLTNSGTATLQISSISISGSGASAFSATNNCSSTLAAGSSCSIGIVFSASPVSTYTANLLVTGNASPTTQTVTLTGTVTGVPQPTLTPPALTFASTTVGTTSSAQTLTLSNTGTAALNFSSISFYGNNASSFAQTNACPATLAIGASCSISVTCTPASIGPLSASLAVNFPSPIPQVASTLGCTGAAPAAPQAALTPATANFGTVTMGTTSPSQTFTLTNAGNAALTVTSIGVTGSNAFSIASKTCAASLAAGASCTVSVAFAPTSAGALTATLSVVDAVGTQSSALSGTGSAPPDFSISATPAAQSSYRGTSVTYTIQLASLLAGNPYNSAVTLSAANLPSGATATFSPATVTPGTAPQTVAMTVTIPALVGQAQPIPERIPERIPRHNRAPQAITLAIVLIGLPLSRRARRDLPRLLLVLLAFGLGLAMSGCGSGNGFAIPVATSTITVTGSSAAVTHSTTVTLTIQ